MIDRYSYPEMRALWAPENRYRKWLEVELLVAEGWAEIGRIPKEAAQALRANGDRLLAPEFDFAAVVHRTLELEGDVPGFEPKPGQPVIRHDLIAFLTAVSDYLGEEKRYLHFGVTSYDIEDTATCMLLRDSCELVAKDMQVLCDAIRERIREHKWTSMIGRTHGVHAEPITLGLKLAVWLAEVERDLVRLRQARESVAVAMASGPAAGLEIVEALTSEPALQGYHLLPSVRGDLLAKLGRLEEARAEFEHAAELTRNARERELLLQRAAACGPQSQNSGAGPEAA